MSSSLINWQVAEGRTRELRDLAGATDAHPFARYVYIAFGPARRRRT
jgi:hypothetical protein